MQEQITARFWWLLAANSTAFLSIVTIFGFAPIGPGDPMDYLEAVVTGEDFRFLDRLLLWFFLRIFYQFGVDPVWIAPVFSLCVAMSVFVAGYAFLYRRFSSVAASFFALLMIASPAWVGVAVHTYPMQGVALCSVFFVIVLVSVQNMPARYFILGFIGGAAALFKIQGVALVIASQCLAIAGGFNPRLMRAAAFGVLSIWIIIFGGWVFVDGAETVASIFKGYVSGTVQAQWEGRALGGIPPYWALIFEPSYFIAAFAVGIGLWRAGVRAMEGQIAITAAVQALLLLAVYLVTWRGGPVITNYVLDSVTVGFMLAGILAGEAARVFSRYCDYQLEFRLTVLISCFIGGAVALQLAAVFHVDNPALFLSKFKYDTYGQVEYVLNGLALLLMLVAGLGGAWWLQGSGERMGAAPLLIVAVWSMLTLTLSAHRGALEAEFRKVDSSRYHQAARLVDDLTHGKFPAYILIADFGQGVETGTVLLNRTIRLFYPSLISRLCRDATCGETATSLGFFSTRDLLDKWYTDQGKKRRCEVKHYSKKLIAVSCG